MPDEDIRMVVRGSGYHDQVYCLVDRARVINRAMGILEPLRGEFDAIAVRGVSGLTVGSILAHLLDKALIVVRKSGEDSHGSPVEGAVRARYIVVDDFTCSGETIRAIREGATGKLEGKCFGVYLWRDERWTPDEGVKDITE